MTRRALIACDVFRDEIAALAGPPEAWAERVFLEMELHDRPDELRRQIQAAIAGVEARHPDLDAVVLAYGLCGNGLAGIRAGRCPIALPQAHDCVSVFMGGADAHSRFLKRHPGAYFYSPGWIRKKRVPGPDRERHLREAWSARYPDDPEMVEELIEADAESFAHHDTAAYISLLENAQAREYCRSCARALNWRFVEIPADAGLLRDLLLGNWEGAGILVVPPGHETAVSGAAGRLVAKPVPG